MNYLDSLNEPQRQAVMTTDGPVLVIAGAGSGKTRVLTMRIAYLLQQGVKPYNILALTFTNKAAKEMKERIAQIVGPEESQQLWMGTFHSIFAKILRIEADAVGLNRDFTIYDTQDSKNLLKSIIKDMGLDEKEYKLSNVMGAISQAKNDLVSPSMYAQDVNFIERDKSARRPRTTDIYNQYAIRLKKSNSVDFDDLLFYTHILFRDHQDILAKYQQKFKYVLVDEYQDTNKAQYVIIKKLVEAHHNICVVGDDAQSIYSFRGARIENILGLERDYPDLKIFKLEQNYRSTQNIVNAANSLIEKNQGRLKKTVFSQNDEGDKIRICSAHSDTEEAGMIVRDIAMRMRNEGLRPQDFAVLYRTNAQSRAFEDGLRQGRIPYRIYGGLAFYQRKEIKDLLAYFRVAVNHNDSESLKRIINYPARAIGMTTIEKLVSAATSVDVSLWQVMQPGMIEKTGLNGSTQNKIGKFVSMIEMFSMQAENLTAYEFAAEVLSQSGIMKELTEGKNDAEGKDRYDNVNELMNSLQDYSQERVESGDDNHIRSYLEEVALISDMDQDRGDMDQVKLMTIHSSKGLEFNSVYIVGVEDETFPGQQSGYNPKELEEERRLMYVALTRAKDTATISYCLSRFQYGQRKDCHPSRFIADIDSEYIDRPDSMNVDRPRSAFRMEQSPRSSFSYGQRTQPVQNPYARNHTGASSPYSSMRQTSGFRSGGGIQRPPSSFKPATKVSSVDVPSGTYSVGQRVVHETFGRGTILAIEGTMPNTKLKIQFDNLGVKQLLVKFARLRPE
ncbi:MAG: UvrD-helicase domain-containing protein [Bacteroidales bacterium]|nr:UvrD-helicase domain-containing protein [Bacteroidales bacterium]